MGCQERLPWRYPLSTPLFLKGPNLGVEPAAIDPERKKCLMTDRMAWFFPEQNGRVPRMVSFKQHSVLSSSGKKQALLLVTTDNCLIDLRMILDLFWQGSYCIKIAQTVRISIFCSKHSGCVLPGPRYLGASHHRGSSHPGWILWSQWQWTGQSYWNIQRDGAGYPGFPAVVCNIAHLEELSLEIMCSSQAWDAGRAKRSQEEGMLWSLTFCDWHREFSLPTGPRTPASPGPRPQCSQCHYREAQPAP